MPLESESPDPPPGRVVVECFARGAQGFELWFSTVVILPVLIGPPGILKRREMQNAPLCPFVGNTVFESSKLFMFRTRSAVLI